MDNHFHLLVRVPHRPERFDAALEVVVARLEQALGGESAKLMERNLAFSRTTKHETAIEEWRQQQVAGCFASLGWLCIGALQHSNRWRGGPSRWYNRRAGRKGTRWEGRYAPVIVLRSEYSSCTVPAPASAVEEEERARRTIAASLFFLRSAPRHNHRSGRSGRGTQKGARGSGP